MVDNRVGGESAHGYMCILVYMKHIWCNGCINLLPIRDVLGSVCHGYMCILLYMTLIQCSGVA